MTGAEIRAARKAKGLSRHELGCIVGVCAGTIAMAERGHPVPLSKRYIEQALSDAPKPEPAPAPSLSQRELASAAGRWAHKLGRAHEWTSEEAAEAGRKSGLKVSQDREHMARIGRKGGLARKVEGT